jgi:hypothetical protein
MPKRRAKLRAVLDVAQSIAVIVAALVSAYAVFDVESDRRRSERRARVERLLPAVLSLAEVAARASQHSHNGASLEVARRRLNAELAVTGIEGFEGTELMTRPMPEIEGIVRQSEVAVREISAALDQLAPRPLLTSWRPKRSSGRGRR